MTKLKTRRRGAGTVSAPTVHSSIDAFLNSSKIKGNANTLRAYTGVLDRAAEAIGPDRALADVADTEVGDALTELWGKAKPATWNRNRAAVGSWLTWCATKQNWTAPTLPAAVERQREPEDTTKAVSRSRIDRLCRRRDVPLREKTLWRMLYESASRASAVLALNVEDLDLPNKQAKITAKGGHTMWITWGTDTAHLLPRLIAGRERGPLFLSNHRPGPHRRATTDPRDICPETQRVRLGYDRARILLGHYGDETDQNRGRSTVRAPGDLPAPLGADHPCTERAPEGLRRTGCHQAAQVHRFTVHGRTTAAGAVVKS
ncbi:MAG: site-specific integrase [Pseudonocardiaceae bacterium]